MKPVAQRHHMDGSSLVLHLWSMFFIFMMYWTPCYLDSTKRNKQISRTFWDNGTFLGYPIKVNDTYDSQHALLSTILLLWHWTKHSQDPPKTVVGYRPSGKSTHHSGCTSSKEHRLGDQTVSSKPSISATNSANRISRQGKTNEQKLIF